eukprot:1053170-Pelagomonas_calceolata.AAC.2
MLITVSFSSTSPITDLDEHGVCSLTYLAVPKCASTTFKTVALRLVERLGLNSCPKHCDECSTHTMHGNIRRLKDVSFYKTGDMKGKRKPKSLLLTSVRHPSSRMKNSYFFFRVSRKGEMPSLRSFTDYVSTVGEDFILRYVDPGFCSNNRRTCVKKVVENYDFIFVADRLADSLALMKLLFGLRFSDVLVTASKVSGTFDEFGNKLIKASPVMGLDGYLQSADFLRRYEGDFELYAYVNSVMDAQILSYGDVFNLTRQVVKLYLSVAQNFCSSRVVFPYDLQTGKKNNVSTCIGNSDSGCDIPCLNELSGIIN